MIRIVSSATQVFGAIEAMTKAVSVRIDLMLGKELIFGKVELK